MRCLCCRLIQLLRGLLNVIVHRRNVRSDLSVHQTLRLVEQYQSLDFAESASLGSLVTMERFWPLGSMSGNLLMLLMGPNDGSRCLGPCSTVGYL